MGFYVMPFAGILRDEHQRQSPNSQRPQRRARWNWHTSQRITHRGAQHVDGSKRSLGRWKFGPEFDHPKKKKKETYDATVVHGARRPRSRDRTDLGDSAGTRWIRRDPGRGPVGTRRRAE